MKLSSKIFICNFLIIALSASCKKLIEIDPPASTITTDQTFADSANASSAVAGLYSSMLNNGSTGFMSGNLTIYPGESADELVPFNSGGDDVYRNTLLADNGQITSFWIPGYQYIYQANSILEGVQASAGISASAKKLFMGEAKFLRSLYYFYLINLFGDVPLVSSIDYHTNALAARTQKAEIYQQIVNDLKDAQNSLPSDYAISGDERTRANSWAATALLARVYLYSDKWDSAAAQATTVINSSLFGLNLDLNGVFLNKASGNTEGILQLEINPRTGHFNATPEGLAFIPNEAPNNNPNYYLSDQLLNAFEPGDQRRVYWVDSTEYAAPDTITYYFPYKYKIGFANQDPNAPLTEFVMVLRLAEQYLIRAEARLHGSDLTGAIEDLNMIRVRAGLTPLDASLDQAQVTAAMAQERRIELFAEWGHRWLDLKRTGQIDAVMNIATPLKGQGTTWQSYQQLYPIPLGELHSDPNLTQNNGY